MDKKYIFIIALILIIVAGGVYYFWDDLPQKIAPFIGNLSCKVMHDEIESDLNNANYCKIDSDCDVLVLGDEYISWGCYHFINKNVDKDQFYKKMDVYRQKCSKMINDCAATPSAHCVLNKCVQVESPVAGEITGKTNNFENSQLLETAKQYVLSKPQLYWNRAKLVNWNSNEIGTDFAKVSPEWIVSQKFMIEYVESNKYQPPRDNLNDKYTVGWFFIPGCEANPNSENEPNWSENGLRCLGGICFKCDNQFRRNS